MDVQDVLGSVARNSFDVRREVVIRNSVFVTNGVPASTTVLRYIDADTLIRVVILGVVKPEKIADLNHFSVLDQRCDSKSMKSVANGGQQSIDRFAMAIRDQLDQESVFNVAINPRIAPYRAIEDLLLHGFQT